MSDFVEQAAELPDEDGLFVERDRSGTQMAEVESLERVIEGLKSAADGARHLGAHRNADSWNGIANRMDSVRKVVVGLARTGDVHAAATSLPRIRVPMPIHEALKRYVDGLKQAMGGARQMATYHRMSEDWLDVNKMLLGLLEGGKAMMRVQMTALRPGGLILPESYH